MMYISKYKFIYKKQLNNFKENYYESTISFNKCRKYVDNDRLTGLWLSELTHFYDELAKSGWDCDFVSPNGGYVPLDPHSLTMMDDVDRYYYKDVEFRNNALGNTLRPEQINAEDYDLIYFAGGHGTMWDFPNSENIAEIASTIYKNGGVVSAVCHGVAGLLPIKDEEGNPLINNKIVTGFTNEEEALNGTSEMVPFMTLDALAEKGAKVEFETPFTPVVRKDDRIFTGQNHQTARSLGKVVVDYFKSKVLND